MSNFLIVYALSDCPFWLSPQFRVIPLVVLFNLACRRIKSESDRIPGIMARRPRPADKVLSRKDLAELQRRLSMMSQTGVEDFYPSAHMVCRIGPGHFPSARAIQELVQAWKQMRKWR